MAPGVPIRFLVTRNESIVRQVNPRRLKHTEFDYLGCTDHANPCQRELPTSTSNTQ